MGLGGKGRWGHRAARGQMLNAGRRGLTVRMGFRALLCCEGGGLGVRCALGWFAVEACKQCHATWDVRLEAYNVLVGALDALEACAVLVQLGPEGL